MSELTRRELHAEVELARSEFLKESAAIRSGALNHSGPRPKAEAFRQSLERFFANLISSGPTSGALIGEGVSPARDLVEDVESLSSS
jgi:hypothetical protein